MAEDIHPAFFGYGSLVNRRTHDYAQTAPARLTGWRRVWRQTRLRPFAFLSIEPATEQIDGLIAAVPGDDWAALDLREAAYLRHEISHSAFDTTPNWAGSLAVYAVDPANGADARHPILLSYLDVVVQGFLTEFGESGVDRFFASTTGWTAIHDDRQSPLYPRHQTLTGAEQRLVDNGLEELGIGRRTG
ncbi:MAG: gamma-glutamylcyclotransferase [Rhodobacteraceae bacterium]|nr:gamma-glutamylcyclotransferase [Paracoccaceae bacterium]